VRVNGIPSENPYSMQETVYNINRPETLVFMERLRQLTDRYPATAMVGEIGAVKDMYQALADYTLRDRRLHMAYSFDFLNRTYSAAHVRRVVESMEAKGGDAWSSWAFSNHDNERVVTRWGLSHDPGAAGPFLIALLTSLRGTPCVYQGEELGLTEAVVPFELLQDPYGIRFWPEFKGRDGCRTPMPWVAAAPHAGFTDGTPWLPVPADHVARSVSVQEGDPASALNRTRAFLGWRRTHPVLWKGEIAFRDAPEGVVCFERRLHNEAMLCAFNLGAAPVSMAVPPCTPLDGHGFSGALDGGTLTLGPLDAFFATL
jgi:alpha-glucosidase